MPTKVLSRLWCLVHVSLVGVLQVNLWHARVLTHMGKPNNIGNSVRASCIVIRGHVGVRRLLGRYFETLVSMVSYSDCPATEVDLIEQAQEEVRLVRSTFVSKLGQTLRGALLVAGAILVVCALASGVVGAPLSSGNPRAATELLEVKPFTDLTTTAALPSDRALLSDRKLACPCSTTNCGCCKFRDNCGKPKKDSKNTCTWNNGFCKSG